ncbi:hypothetical protein [uncultured Victivallis sp.]|uniref:hypothetical protein n=1 Tax=uncultured Victivallis sp. TaxID=354118 RepID=UPI0025928DA4|nr:hypothetical protein [uncultured Victivallis sp.]
MGFPSQSIIENCMLRDLREKDVYENGEKSSRKKLVVDLLVFGDKPVTIEVPSDKAQAIKLGVMGVCRLYANSEMSATLYRRDDGSQGISYKKTDKDFMFFEFAVNPPPVQQGK